MLKVHRGLVLCACVSVGFAISAGPGVMARAAEPDRWIRALADTPTTPSTPEKAAQHRIAELERRITELEAERRAQVSQKSLELAAAAARNEELAERNLALSLENRELAQGRGVEPSRADQPPSEADPRAQIRYWAKQVRDGETSSRRLSPEWNAAVSVLLRRERPLDPQNPWHEP
jgi:hypothetical protein